MGFSPTQVVLAWLAAANAGDVETALALTASEVTIVGPRGTSRGHDVLRDWLTHAGATFETRGIYAQDEAVVVRQYGLWREAASGEIVGEADVATRFRVSGGLVAEIQRYEDVTAAVRDAGFSSS